MKRFALSISLSFLLFSFFLLLAPARVVRAAFPPSFGSAAPYGAGTDTRSVAVADFNGDGKLDLAAANYGSDNVSVLFGNGNGTFASDVLHPVAWGPRSLAVGDFNGDGKPDLAVANADADTVSVLVNNGNGTFATHVDYGVGVMAYSVAVLDYDGDGKLDLAVANYTSNNVSVLRNNGNGTFAAHVDYAAGTNPAYVTVGDFNGDGKPDLAVANNSSNTVSVLRNNGNGTFATHVDYPVHTYPYSIAVGDYNGDGKPDLAIANYGNSDVSVLQNNGAGSFGSPVNYPADYHPFSVAAGDFNGDGKLDLAAANYDSYDVSVLQNNGNGAFAAAVNFDAYVTPRMVAVGDFNGDGKPDLAFANAESNYVSVALNTTIFPPAATTNAASGIMFDGATLNGTVNAYGTSTSVTFQYGPTTSYGTTVTATQSPVTGTGSVSVSKAISGLTPNMLYHYRVVATSAGGTTNGGDQTFSTIAIAPAVMTGAATGVTSVDATLNGTVNANNASASVTFQYGLNTSYGTSISATPATVSGTTFTAVSAALSGLTPNTTYHYRAVATSIGGMGFGADQTFSTNMIAPSMTTGAATYIWPTSATLNGTVNPNNSSTSVTFEYGLDTSYGTTVGATPGTVTGYGNTAVGAVIYGLSAATTYHYRVVGQSGGGTGYGNDQAFTTSPRVSTTTAVTSSPNPTVFGQSVTFTATVDAVSPGPGAPTGTVSFYEIVGSGGGEQNIQAANPVLGTVRADGPEASFTWTTSALSAGTHNIGAIYSGDMNYNASTSAPYAQVVNESGTAVAVTALPNPSNYGHLVTLTATVTRAGDGGPISGGTVAFKDGGVTLPGCGTQGTTGGQATCATAALSVGAHPISAVYSGDANCLGSTSPTVSVTVEDVPSGFHKLGPSGSTPIDPGNVNLSWESSTNATSYEYCINTSSTCSSPASWTGTDAETSATPSGLSYGATYYWQVRARNNTGTTDADGGQWWSFSTEALEDNLAYIQYDGWRGAVDAKASGGTYRVSNVKSDKVTFKFKGTSITWLTHTGPDQGQAQVTIDGRAAPTVDLYSPSDAWKVLKSYGNLADRTHTLMIKVLGTKNSSSLGYNVVVDAFQVGTATSEENSVAIKYNTWTGATDSNASGGSYRWSATKNATISLTFTGATINWTTATCKSCGKAQVIIGTKVYTEDLYSLTPQWNVVKSYPADEGTHTIQIKVLGQKNPKATGIRVIVDAFSGPIIVTGPAANVEPESEDDTSADSSALFWLAPVAMSGIATVRRGRRVRA